MAKYPDPIITNKAIIFNLHEPIYGSVFAIYDKWLKIAKNRGLLMVVNTPFGKATYKSADEWVKGAKKIKKYHNFPEPMIMYQRAVLPDIKDRIKRKKIEKRVEMSGDLVLNAMAQLQRKNPKLLADVKRKLGIK